MELKRRLEGLGLNQSRLAERLGVTRETVSRWRGEVPEYAERYMSLLERLQEVERMVHKALKEER